jgi:hypothetical protein
VSAALLAGSSSCFADRPVCFWMASLPKALLVGAKMVQVLSAGISRPAAWGGGGGYGGWQGEGVASGHSWCQIVVTDDE